MDTLGQRQPDVSNDMSPECKLSQLEAQWLEAWKLDEFGRETAILGNKVLKARARLSYDEEELPEGSLPTFPLQSASHAITMTHRQEVLGLDYRRSGNGRGLFKRLYDVGVTATAMFGIVKS